MKTKQYFIVTGTDKDKFLHDLHNAIKGGWRVDGELQVVPVGIFNVKTQSPSIFYAQRLWIEWQV